MHLMRASECSVHECQATYKALHALMDGWRKRPGRTPYTSSPYTSLARVTSLARASDSPCHEPQYYFLLNKQHAKHDPMNAFAENGREFKYQSSLPRAALLNLAIPRQRCPPPARCPLLLLPVVSCPLEIASRTPVQRITPNKLRTLARGTRGSRVQAGAGRWPPRDACTLPGA